KKWLEELDTQRALEEQCPQFVIPSRLEREYQGKTSESDQHEERRPLRDERHLPVSPKFPYLVNLQPYIQRAKNERTRLGNSRIGRCWTIILQELSSTIPTSVILEPYYVSNSDLEKCYHNPDPMAVLFLLLIKSHQPGLRHVADIYLKSLLYPA